MNPMQSPNVGPAGADFGPRAQKPARPTRPAKLDFYDALQAINDQQGIDSDSVQARALRRYVWVAEWHIPGCLSESFSVHVTKRDALADALGMCDHARGAASDLRKYGRTDRVSPNAYVSCAITTIERRQLRTLF